jgi:hypothetical protein
MTCRARTSSSYFFLRASGAPRKRLHVGPCNRRVDTARVERKFKRLAWYAVMRPTAGQQESGRHHHRRSAAILAEEDVTYRPDARFLRVTKLEAYEPLCADGGARLLLLLIVPGLRGLRRHFARGECRRLPLHRAAVRAKFASATLHDTRNNVALAVIARVAASALTPHRGGRDSCVRYARAMRE